MKQILLFILVIATNQLAGAQNLQLNQLEGKWFVNRSNFPMWLKGNKTHPSFNYSIIVKNGDSLLLDEVLYEQRSKTKSISGYDKSANTNNTAFVWRGKGILSLVKSKWNILYFDAEQKWMIIHFDKTLFTPEGYDVVSRAKTINAELETEVLKKLEEIGVKEELSVILQE